MNDRALELAIALMLNPWIDSSIKKICEGLIKKWENEDMNKINQKSTNQPP